MGNIFTSFNDIGILIKKLNMFVGALMACVPKCCRCQFEMPSGPVQDVFFVFPRALLTICVMNGDVTFVV